MRLGFGILECFFGPPWTSANRAAWADFMAANAFNFYLYGPKADALLRKQWATNWSQSYKADLQNLARLFRDRGVGFGVALSPFGINLKDGDHATSLTKKVRLLDGIGITHLGLFFDDMPVNDGLAATQLEAIRLVQDNTHAQVMFCPSFYSHDPILAKVFGAQPPDYWPTLAAKLPKEVACFWTGPKVISPEISASHLTEVTTLLGRRPAIFDNLFANDGPKQCRFLKVIPPTGRSSDAVKHADAWAFNPMNQSTLSQIAALAAKTCLTANTSPTQALHDAIGKVCPPALGDFLRSNGADFASLGLDKLDDSIKSSLLAQLISFPAHPAADEISHWLKGDFIVGPECLTD